jgi:hypothetical protein
MLDTSVLCELLQVPGKSSLAKNREVIADLDRRCGDGERLVIPVTAVIETGNHIAQCDGDRYAVAERLVQLLRQAVSEDGPWRVLQSRLGTEFLTALCDGDSTGQTLETLAAQRVGAGDVAILVERDQLLADTALATIGVWTFDEGLKAQAAVRP